MNKTGDEIELDVFNIITNSQLAKEIKGNVYREGTRDLNPMDEVVRALKPTDYRFSLGATIKSYKAEKVAMHFVNVKINFELKTF